jgi:geranylgeranyl pyrophosphate synthase
MGVRLALRTDPPGIFRPPDFQADRDLIDRELDLLLPEAAPGDRVAEAIRHAVFGGAQRIRPMLSLRVARALGAESAAVLRAAAATELVHCASLVIDDLPCMDDSDTRRGRPSVHAQFGEATAVLSGFAIVALAARSTMDPIVANGSGARLTRFLWSLLSVLGPGSLIRGQALDLQPGARSTLIDHLKTVPLFELAVEAGGVSSPAYDRLEPHFREFARHYGRAFQMTDDYLDGDLTDAEAALSQVGRARTLAERLEPSSTGLVELVDFLNAKITQDRRHR